MADFAFRLAGLGALKNATINMRRALKDTTLVNKKQATAAFGWVQRNFRSGGQLSGGKWEPLARDDKGRTYRQKTHRAGEGQRTHKPESGAKILQDTGDLRQRWKLDWNRTFAKIQSGVPYGLFHDNPKKGSKLPQRKITPTNNLFMPIAMKIYRQHIKSSAGRFMLAVKSRFIFR
jgi:phage gpG-like protein